MARNIHKHLSYERKELEHAKYHLKCLSDICYEVDALIGPDFLKEQVWTFGMGITFRDTDQEQYKVIKTLLPRLSQLEKKSSKYGLQLSGTCAEKKICGQKTNLTVNFKWDVPDTCEVVNKIVKEKADDDYYIGEDGDIYFSRTETEINCTEPVLESVFSSLEKRNTVSG